MIYLFPKNELEINILIFQTRECGLMPAEVIVIFLYMTPILEVKLIEHHDTFVTGRCPLEG